MLLDPGDSCSEDATVYELRAPSESLQGFIEHYWFVRAEGEGESLDLRVDVFVDARADLIFNFGASYRRSNISEGDEEEVGRSNFDAQRLFPIRIAQSGGVNTVGVRFRLAGVAPFAIASLRTFTNTLACPAEIFGEGIEELERALRTTDDVDAQRAALDAFFVGRLRNDAAPDAFWRALRAATASEGSASVSELAEAASISARQLERLFARHLGITPKSLTKVLRFQKALKGLMRDPGCTLAEVATTAGYFDQAHFIKDFKAMTGGVPRGYRGYYPPEGPADFAPNVVVFLQDDDS